MTYIISLGSNEEREKNLLLARKRLKELFPDICFSNEEETLPVRFHRTNMFSNQLACFVSDANDTEIISQLKAIEEEAGRTMQEKAKEIVRLDIDLLSCDDKVYKHDDWDRDYVQRGLEQLENKIK